MKTLHKAVTSVFKDVLTTYTINQQFIVTGVVRACAGDNSEIVIGDLHEGEVLSFTANTFDQCELTIRSRCESSALRDIKDYFNQTNTSGYADFVFDKEDVKCFDDDLMHECVIEDAVSVHLHYLNFNETGQYTASIFVQLR